MERSFKELLDGIVGGDMAVVRRRLARDPALATRRAEEGATRQQSSAFFIKEIAHYVYAGDTALHIAAADSISRSLPC